jgi:dTMP kinase
LADAFKAQGRAVTLTREPGGTPLAEKLRALVLNDPMDAMTEALLVFAARRDHLQQVIEPALARGDVVLCDRFTDATFAYQGGGRGFDLTTLTYLEQLVQTSQGLHGHFVRHPDLTIWFDLSPEVASTRLSGVRVPDKFEAQPATFFAKVRAGYLARSIEHGPRFARIDADRSIEAVWQAVYGAVKCRGWLA